MPPITWRNVDAPTATGSARILEAAGRSVNKGLGQLGGLVKEHERVLESNRLNETRRATDSVLAQIAGLDLEGVNAAVKDGSFSADNLPLNVDQKAIDLALNARPNQIADQLAKTSTYATAQRNRDEAPLRQEAQNALAQGDYELAAELNQGLYDQSGITRGIAAAKRASVNQQRADANYFEQQAFRQNEPARQEAAATLAHERELAQIQLAADLEENKQVKTGTPQQESADILAQQKRIANIAPNEQFVADTLGSAGGLDAQNLVKDGIAALEAKYKRKLTAAEWSQVGDTLESGGGGKDNVFFGQDRYIAPKDGIAKAEELLKGDSAATISRIKRKGAKNTKAQADLDAKLKQLSSLNNIR